MILSEAFGPFTVYKSDAANTFLYAHFDNPTLFMDGLADYLLSEENLLNYANTLTPISFRKLQVQVGHPVVDSAPS